MILQHACPCYRYGMLFLDEDNIYSRVMKLLFILFALTPKRIYRFFVEFFFFYLAFSLLTHINQE